MSEKVTLRFTDLVTLSPDPNYSKLNKSDKVKFLDSLLGDDPDKRGLIITYDLSHSARRINNRIYPPIGQMRGIDTLMTPYPKPILLFHDDEKDPIGRFIGGEWHDLSSEAMKFFTNIKDFMAFKRVCEEDNPKKIYSFMKKHALLTNPRYPGMGRMRVKARIVDRDAIEKFLDGRYQTFSAHSTTDRFVCSICDQNWITGEFCEHSRGMIYDGELCVFITGLFDVKEGSVVNIPADDMSSVLSMELVDDNGVEISSPINSKDIMDKDTIFMTDSVFSNYKEIQMPNLEELQKKLEATEDALLKLEGEKRTADEKIKELETEKVDAEKVLADKLEEERNKLKAEENRAKEEALKDKEEKDNQFLDVLIALLAQLPEGIDKEGLYDSIVGASGVDAKLSTEKRKSLPASAFCGPQKSYPVNDEAHARAALRLLGHASPSAQSKIRACVCRKVKANGWDVPACKTKDAEEEMNLVADKFTDEETKELLEKEAMVMCPDADWYLLSVALEQELGEKKLSQEDLAKAEDSAFMGPNRTFAVPNCDYLIAARKVLEKISLPDEQKSIFLSCLDRRGENLGCSDTSDASELQKSYDNLKEEHANVLKDKEKLEKDRADVVKLVARILEKDFSDVAEGERDSKMLEWFGSLDNEEIVRLGKIASIKVDDPNGTSSQNTNKKQLNSFEQGIVSKWKEVRDKKGEEAADQYLDSSKRYLPRGFNPRNFIGE